MSSLDLELTTVSRRWRIRQPRQAGSLVPASPSLPGEPVSLLKLLVEKSKATDHGAALVPWAGSTFARHNPARPMEETSMS
jgi:hypothetical protein